MPTFLLRDLRYGWRVLTAKPGFALAAILTLALGIGANALVFALIDGVYMRDLPYRQSSALVDVYSSMVMFGGGYDTVSVPAPPLRTLLAPLPSSVSLRPEPVRFSILISVSPWASPPLPVPVAKLTVTPEDEAA